MTTTSHFIDVPRTRRPSARSFRLGIEEIDSRAVEHRAIEPTSLTLIAGRNFSGRTTTAVGVAQAAVADLAGTDQKVVFLAVEPSSKVRVELSNVKYQRNLRYAEVASVTDVTHALATVFADAYAQAKAAGDRWEQHAPVLLVIDDAGMLEVSPFRSATSEMYRTLLDLCADLATGAFSLDVQGVIGDTRDRLAAFADARTRSGLGLPVATVLTVRASGHAGPVRAEHLPHELLCRAHLVVNPLHSGDGSRHPRVIKSRSMRSDA